MDAAILQGANHLESGAITNVAETLEGVTTKSSLENLTVSGPIEERSPLFEFPHALRRLLRVNLGHAPVVEKLAAAHGVAKVRAPVIGRVDIATRRGDAAF